MLTILSTIYVSLLGVWFRPKILIFLVAFSLSLSLSSSEKQRERELGGNDQREREREREFCKEWTCWKKQEMSSLRISYLPLGYKWDSSKCSSTNNTWNWVSKITIEREKDYDRERERKITIERESKITIEIELVLCGMTKNKFDMFLMATFYARQENHSVTFSQSFDLWYSLSLSLTLSLLPHSYSLFQFEWRTDNQEKANGKEKSIKTRLRME